MNNSYSLGLKGDIDSQNQKTNVLTLSYFSVELRRHEEYAILHYPVHVDSLQTIHS